MHQTSIVSERNELAGIMVTELKNYVWFPKFSTTNINQTIKPVND